MLTFATSFSLYFYKELILKNDMSMRFIICLFSFMCVSHVVYCQTENVINSILEESLVNYFNIQDSIRMKNNIAKQTDRFVCMEGFPLGYDFNKNNNLIFHDGSYYAIKKLKKHNESGISSASVFLNFQDDYFVVSIVSRYISYKNRKECKIQSSDSIHFKYKYDSKTNSWKRVSQEIVAL